MEESPAPQNVACRSCEWGNTNQDIRHTLTINGVYEIPVGEGRRFLRDGGALSHVLGGWQLSGVMQTRTGRPLTISVTRSSADLPDGNNSGQRADLVAGVPMQPDTPTADQWINAAAFAVPAGGT